VSSVGYDVYSVQAVRGVVKERKVRVVVVDAWLVVANANVASAVSRFVVGLRRAL